MERGFCIPFHMPLQTQPEDLPAAVRFRLEQKDGALEVTVATLQQHRVSPLFRQVD